jgi:hypothetical protein
VLEVTSPRQASVALHMNGAKTAILGIFGVVSPYRQRGRTEMIHIMEAIGDRVVGGISIRVRV